jgi:hypothetical protein
MPAPPARLRGLSVHGRGLLVMVATMMVATSCNLFLGIGPTPIPSAAESQGAESQGAPASDGSNTASLGPCQPAPDWLVSALQDGLVVRGATLSEVYAGEASSFSSGPEQVLSASFAQAWWIVAKINGAGVRPEAAIWVTNRTQAGTAGDIFAANPAALRYSEWGQGGSIAIRGDGQDALLACLTPIPES